MKRLTILLALKLALSSTCLAEPPQAPPLRDWQGPPVEVSAERTAPARTRAQPAYRWTREHPGQLSLWDGAKQVGAWREADGVYLAYPGWTVAELPTPLPEGRADARPFVNTAASTPAMSALTAAERSLPRADAGQSRSRIFTPASVGIGGITGTSRLCVGRT